MSLSIHRFTLAAAALALSIAPAAFAAPISVIANNAWDGQASVSGAGYTVIETCINGLQPQSASSA